MRSHPPHHLARVLSGVLFALILAALTLLPIEAAAPPTGADQAATPPITGTLRGPLPPRSLTHSIDDPLPTRGDQKLLVVLVDFSDQGGIFAQQQFTQQFFGSWSTGSFADFFREVSYNQLRYTGDVVGILNGTPVANSSSVAYVRAPQPKSYYADGVYGFGDNFPRNSTGLFLHAIQQLEAGGFDFAPYADPTTRKVENVLVVFAGRPFVISRIPTDLQPTAYSLTYYQPGGYTTGAGYHFANFTLCSEQYNFNSQAPIGICTHEHGHGLGMFDLYDLSYQTIGVGFIDLMGVGLYGSNDGTRPFHPGPYSKQHYGWITPTLLAPGSYTVTLAPFETSGQLLKLTPFGETSQEYFLVENRQHLGFDDEMGRRGLCKGVQIWHIDADIVSGYASSNLVNTLPSAGGPPHQGVILVEADGRFDMSRGRSYGECSDTWAVGRTWNADTTPSSRLWDSTLSGLSLSVLSEAGGAVTVRVDVARRPVLPARVWIPVVARGR